MQAENITPDHNRTIRISDVPEIGNIEITIDYTHKAGSGRGGEPHILDKAIALDNHVIPYIIKAVNYLNMREECVKPMRNSSLADVIDGAVAYLKKPLEIRMDKPERFT